MNAAELGKAAQSLGLRWLCVHGRTRQQQYSGKADYAAIARVREQLSIPVIANGDVFAGSDAARILRETGCRSLMIGRGAMGNPWLFRDALAAMEGREAQPVTLAERVETARLHARWMVEYKGERMGVMEMRKHIGQYISGLRGATALRRELNLAKTLQELETLLGKLEES
jgi:tRNA-dihydrouridine synthase